MTPILLTSVAKTTVVLDAERIALVTTNDAKETLIYVDVGTGPRVLVRESPLQVYGKITEALGPAASADEDEDEEEDEDVITCPECDSSDLMLQGETDDGRDFVCDSCGEVWFEEWPEEDDDA